MNKELEKIDRIIEQLLPCPFCGKKDFVIHNHSSPDGTIQWYRVLHYATVECSASMLCNGSDEIIQQWNKRTALAAQDGEGSIYQALYNPMTEESGYVTLSIHKTREGAQKAIDEHKSGALEEYNKRPKTISNIPFAQFEDWRVDEIKLLNP